MTFDDFKASLKKDTPPQGLSPLLKALWYDGKNDWDNSHNIAQDIHSNEGSWIHAYLHRKEGDSGNAAYWYRKAGRPVPAISSENEWETIVKSLI
jgi:phage major head subunit gpT-like protein